MRIMAAISGVIDTMVAVTNWTTAYHNWFYGITGFIFTMGSGKLEV